MLLFKKNLVIELVKQRKLKFCDLNGWLNWKEKWLYQNLVVCVYTHIL